MKELLSSLIKNLKGDKGIWTFVALLALFSFMPVFSASSNLAYGINGNGNTLVFLVKHSFHIFVGFIILYKLHKVSYTELKWLSVVVLPFVWLILLFTLISGKAINGANASRWLTIPFTGISFQPSTIASVVLMIFVARYLSKNIDKTYTFSSSLFSLWLPVFITLILILPANFSTTALMFSMVLMLVFIGEYPLKYIAYILSAGIAFLMLFFLLSKAFPDSKLFSRVSTWEARAERFFSDKPGEDDYQIEKAKIAIASGKIYGLGPGKSVQKNFLPQSSSDFIYAIIIEEYGLVGGLGVIILYILLFIRFIVAIQKATNIFGKLLIVGLGFPLVFQALINMCVAVELMPVTGQPLPLISSGGTSVWMTCVALAIIISVTKKDQEIADEIKEKEKRDEVLKKLIDKQILEEQAMEEQDDSYSIQDKTVNPMDAVRNK